MTLDAAIEIVADRLYFVAEPPGRLDPEWEAFTIESRYDAYYADFGPCNLAQTHRFCQEIQAKLADPATESKKLLFYSHPDVRRRTNSLTLMCLYQVICLGRSSDDAFERFRGSKIRVMPYRDATYGPCHYKLTIKDVIKGMEYAIKLGWYSFDNFDLEQYEYYENIANGDLNWIIPGKFIAFSGPSSSSVDEDGFDTHSPDHYIKIFKDLGVELIIRLNKKQYDRKEFTDAGFKHLDLYFIDGSCPSDDIVDKFLEAARSTPGPIAVHCKAGLGRTGTLIGCYAMRYHRFKAAYWVGWNRLARPGSVLGPQQYYLNQVQRRMWELEENSEDEVGVLKKSLAKMSLNDAKKAVEGDTGQAERLLVQKHKAVDPRVDV